MAGIAPNTIITGLAKSMSLIALHILSITKFKPL